MWMLYTELVVKLTNLLTAVEPVILSTCLKRYYHYLHFLIVHKSHEKTNTNALVQLNTV